MMNELLQRKQIPQQWIFSIRHHRTHHPEGLVFLPVELEDALMQKISVSLSLSVHFCAYMYCTLLCCTGCHGYLAILWLHRLRSPWSPGLALMSQHPLHMFFQGVCHTNQKKQKKNTTTLHV